MRPRHLTFNEPEPTSTPDPVVKEIIEQVFPPKRKLPRHLDFAKKYPEQKKQSETVEEPEKPEEQPEESEEPETVEEPDKPSFKGRPRHLDFTRKYKKKIEENRPAVQEERITYPVSLPIYRMLMPQSSKKGVKVKMTEDILFPRLRNLFLNYYNEVGETEYNQGSNVVKFSEGASSEYGKIGRRKLDDYKDLENAMTKLETFLGSTGRSDRSRAERIYTNEGRALNVKLNNLFGKYKEFMDHYDQSTNSFPPEILDELERILLAEEEAYRLREEIEPQEIETEQREEPETEFITDPWEGRTSLRERLKELEQDFEPEQRPVFEI